MPAAKEPVQPARDLTRLRTLPSADGRPRAHLPSPLAPFFGRVDERAALAALLRRPETRLVTLLGPGGVGKSRLALSVASDLAPAFADGVLFVPLAAVARPDLVLPAVATALGARESGDRRLLDRLVDLLSGRDLLLLLDTFEHVVDAAAELAQLLTLAPGPKALVTSRAVVHVSGERVVPLAPFPAASASNDPFEHDAVRLFVDRASAASAGFVTRHEDGPTLAAICDRLDGLPLAIELAASRTRLFSPAALLDRLDRRLPVLAPGPRDLPDRLRTMRGAIAWSCNLLAPDEQVLFRRLGVFAGGFTPLLLEGVISAWDAPDAFPADVLGSLASLVDQSLLIRQEQPGEEIRLTMLDTIQEFALGELVEHGELATARAAHARACLAWAEHAKPHMFGEEQARWLDQAEREHPNLRAALAWAVEAEDAETAVRLAAAALGLWGRRGHFREGLTWLERVLALPGPAPADARAVAHFGAGMLASNLGDVERARAASEAGLALSRASGDIFGEGLALLLRCWLDVDQGELEAARWAGEMALARFASLPERPRVADALQQLAIIARLQGNHARHADLAAQHLAESRRIGDRWNVALGTVRQAEIARIDGDLRAALDYVRDGVGLWRETGVVFGVASGVNEAAFLAAACGQPLIAARWLAASAVVTDALGDVAAPALVANRAAIMAAAEAVASAETAMEAWRSGLAAPLDVVVAEVLAYDPPAAMLAGRAQKPAAPDGLTTREIEVLRLIADGHSNRAIGDRLGISQRTAAAHVVNILNKLGLDSRTAAAAHAIRHGIA